MTDAVAAIKAAALDLIERADGGDVPVQAIRSAAGVSNGSFFHHFPTKAALLGSLYLDGLRAYHVDIERAVTGPADVGTGIRAAIGAHVEWATTTRRSVGSLVLGDRAELMDQVGAERDEENRRFRTVLDRWRAGLVEGGHIHDVDVDTFIAVVVGPAHVLCRTWAVEPGSRHPAERIDHLVGAALRGLGAIDAGEGWHGRSSGA